MYLFDTSSIIAFLDNEDGADVVQEYFSEIDAKTAKGCISVITIAELYGIYRRIDGESAAKDRISRLKASGLSILAADERIGMEAGRIKLQKVPTADSFIAATAKLIGAKLIASDKHFEGLGIEVIKFR